MLISNYIKMNYNELGEEITKQRKKIAAAKETIKLLEKLQIAEQAKQNMPEQQNVNNDNTGFHEGGGFNG